MSQKDLHALLCSAVFVVGAVWVIRRLVLPMLLGLFELRNR